MFAIIIISTWQSLGFNMIIFQPSSKMCPGAKGSDHRRGSGLADHAP